MVGKLGAFFQALATHLIALAVVWVLLVGVSYVMLRWCFQRQIPWVRAAHWITGAMGVVLGGMGVLYALPLSLTLPISTVIIPHGICAMALHSLLLAVDRYMRHRFGEGIIQTRLVLFIITIYAVTILGAIVLIKVNNSFLSTISSLVFDYLTRGAIMGLLVLEIWGGRCKEPSDESTSGSFMSKRW